MLHPEKMNEVVAIGAVQAELITDAPDCLLDLGGRSLVGKAESSLENLNDRAQRLTCKGHGTPFVHGHVCQNS